MPEDLSGLYKAIDTIAKDLGWKKIIAYAMDPDVASEAIDVRRRVLQSIEEHIFVPSDDIGMDDIRTMATMAVIADTYAPETNSDPHRGRYGKSLPFLVLIRIASGRPVGRFINERKIHMLEAEMLPRLEQGDGWRPAR